MSVAPLVPSDQAVNAQEALAELTGQPHAKFDWIQFVLFLVAFLCFTGAAILWMHSGQTP